MTELNPVGFNSAFPIGTRIRYYLMHPLVSDAIDGIISEEAWDTKKKTGKFPFED